ncbi:MAG TPA: TonB family protein [Gammaproteobacteria bacterium]|nr:TonB family protein [Gammaproteobacteria bacterium]
MKRISTILPALVLLTLSGCASKPIAPPANVSTPPPQPPHKSAPKTDKKSQTDPRLPNVTVPIIYPQIALDQGIEGYVLLEFNVTKTGTLQNIKVIDSTPPGYFEQEALRAASQFRYEPKIVNGEPVEVPRAQYKMIFELKYLRPR